MATADAINIHWTGDRHFRLDPNDPQFFENPGTAYQALHARGGPVFWEDYQLWCLVHRTHLQDFASVERYSLLCLEPPKHTDLRKRVNRAFASSQVNQLSDSIEALAHRCIDQFESERQVDLLSHYATPIPVTVIAQLLGVPTQAGEQLLAWSNSRRGTYC